jgi:hypothetical protein
LKPNVLACNQSWSRCRESQHSLSLEVCNSHGSELQDLNPLFVPAQISRVRIGVFLKGKHAFLNQKINEKGAYMHAVSIVEATAKCSPETHGFSKDSNVQLSSFTQMAIV